MNEILHTKYLPSKDGFDITFQALVESIPYYMEHNSDGDGDGDGDEEGKRQHRELCEGIENGWYVYFCAKITASKYGIELGSTYLGCCIYEWYDDFIEDDYCKDMIDEAIAKAKDNIKRLCEDACP